MGNLPIPGMAAVVGTVRPKIIIGRLSVIFKRHPGAQRYCCKLTTMQGDGALQDASLLFNYFNLDMPAIKSLMGIREVSGGVLEPRVTVFITLL